jgi:hypothetical protein
MTRTAAADFSERVRADLQRRRDQAAAKADELQAQSERWPHEEIRQARDAAVRRVNALDQAIAASS